MYYPRSGSLPVSALSGNIMDGVDIEDLTMKQYLRLTQESQAPKKIEDITIINTPNYDPTLEFAHYFGPNQPSAESDYDSEDIEEEVEYMTNNEIVMSEQEESNHEYAQITQQLEDEDDVDEWVLKPTCPFKMGRCRDEIASSTDGLYLGPEQDSVAADLSQVEKDRLRADIRTTNILLQGLPRDIYKLINHNTDAKDI
ncbi:hypothetical protein Tco_0480327 [Tanacetum coccineum]